MSQQFLETVLADGGADIVDEFEIISQVMETQQAHRSVFLSHEKVSQIRQREGLAGVAAAVGVQGVLRQTEF